MIWLYGLTFLAVLSSLQLMSFSSLKTTRFRSTLAGSTGGGIGFNWFSNWTQTGSFIQHMADGGAGNMGFFYLSGLIALVCVWGWNLVTTRKYLVR